MKGWSFRNTISAPLTTPASVPTSSAERKDHVARHVKDQRQVEHDHADEPDNGTDGEIDPAHKNGECLSHGEDGHERVARKQVLHVRGSRKAGRADAEESDCRHEEQDERYGGGAEYHGILGHPEEYGPWNA